MTDKMIIHVLCRLLCAFLNMGGGDFLFGRRSAEFAENFVWRKAGGSARNRAESARIHMDSRESAAEGLPPSI